MDATPQFAVVLNDARDVVEVFSTERLPFEPRGWLLDMRGELRAALKQMRAGDGALLGAVYASPVEEFCDVENVLIYNVGAANFSGIAGLGIRLERGYFCPPPPVALDGETRHYACYAVAPLAQGFACWKRGDMRAQWAEVPMPALSETTRPSSVWHAMRTGSVRVLGSRGDSTAPYGLELVVGAQGDRRPQAAKIVKPLVDGVVAGLHCHDGSALDDLSARLAAQIPGASREGITALLREERASVLGRRRLLWPRANGVQWNPADDLCVALELRVEPAARLQLSGCVFEVEAGTA